MKRKNQLILYLLNHTFGSVFRKIVFVFVSLGVFFPNMAYCAEVDTTTAKSVARNFYNARLSQSKIGGLKSITREIQLELIHQESLHSTDGNADIRLRESLAKPLYYIYNVLDNNGFVIVSGDDRVIPILGYTFSGKFSKENQSPAYKNWMQHYSDQIMHVLNTDQKADDFIQREWRTYLNPPSIKSGLAINEVLPLLTTTWDQDCYYNELCPYDDDGSCNHAPVGCVAVALAQIMKFWNHPASSNQIPGYYDDYNYEYFQPITGSDYGCIPDIDVTHYPWSEMLDQLDDESTDRQKTILSELLYNTGVASQMNFGPTGSSTSDWNAYQTLKNYFHYSPSAELIFREDHSDESWEMIIREELDNNRPMYYAGGPHAFVCDGYQDTNYMHFNWGWSGWGDGYFYLSDLAPFEIDLNDYQITIIGIVPGIHRPDPYSNIVQINGWGSEHIQTFAGGGVGAWNLSDCGYPTPGTEQVYSFIAPDTGIYSLEVISSSGYVDYLWRASHCGEPGWSCIDDVIFDGSYGILSWTGGTTYHILLDDEDSIQGAHEFYVNYLGLPVLEYSSYKIDDDDNIGSGNNNGLAEPGENIEMMVSLKNSGTGDVHNVSAVISTTDPDISLSDEYEIFGDIVAGGNLLCETGYYFSISSDCPVDRDVKFNLDITSDEGNWTDQFVVHIYPLPPDPCENIITINGYGSEYSQVFTGGGGGAWGFNDCGTYTPGIEQIYSFVAPDTGIYSIEVISANSDVNYTWSTSECGEPGWNCVHPVDSAGSFGLISWMGGTTYYILLDDQDTTAGIHEFYVNYLGLPVLEYDSYKIDDDDSISSGNNNGLAEPGETIELMVTMKNSGTGDAHNVSAVITTTDPDISLNDEYETFGDIVAGGNILCDTGYNFTISSACPGDRDVTFTIDITSDEGTWTDQFVVHVYPPPPDPCDNIIYINGYGSEYSQTFTGGGKGIWNAGICGFDTPGVEKVYSFVAPETGIYSIEVISANSDVNYMWSTSECGEPGWNCVHPVDSAGSFGLFSWTGGTTYFILLDDQDTTAGIHEFYVNYLGLPVLEYDSYKIDDDDSISSGNNNGLAEPGETIELMVTMKNSGTGDAHNVSAVITTTDPDISLNDEYETFGDIVAGGNILCDTGYNFTISSACPGDRDVTFTIDITSDEGTWTDQFVISIHKHNTTVLQNLIENKFKMYPNPTESLIYVKSESYIESQIFICVRDYLGRSIHEQVYGYLIANEEIKIDLSNYGAGIYVIQIYYLDKMKTGKIIKR